MYTFWETSHSVSPIIFVRFIFYLYFFSLNQLILYRKLPPPDIFLAKRLKTYLVHIASLHQQLKSKLVPPDIAESSKYKRIV